MKTMIFVLLFVVALLKTMFDISDYVYDPYERGWLYDDDKNNIVTLIALIISLIAILVFYILYATYYEIAIAILLVYNLIEVCISTKLKKI